MNLFIAGICGTFMAGIAQLARAAGHSVTGCDANVYPPMSTLLESLDIPVLAEYDAAHLREDYDQIIIGNALSRGNPVVEAVLDQRLRYTSGPQWLNENYLVERRVIAVSGTHGKTTTSSMATWILHHAAETPGYLIGGKPGNFEHSAEPGASPWFVIEADEYDTAFFDKRSKFVHYSPSIAILNNLEFDHADIFSDLDQIKTQFHHLIRIVPSNGCVIANADDANITDVLDMGCWSRLVRFSLQDPQAQWFARPLVEDCSSFEVFHKGDRVAEVSWSCLGRHNMENALAAIIACCETGLEAETCARALQKFIPSRRRLEKLYSSPALEVYEDFAHHPTAIASTLEALKAHHPGAQLLTVLELRSNTMRMGSHGQRLGEALKLSDKTFIYLPLTIDWDPLQLEQDGKLATHENVQAIIEAASLSVSESSAPKTVIVCMSNGSFDGIPATLVEQLGHSPVQ